ncbi:MAG TPA: KamA family radical SAM protein, partial [Planctomycetota bacterium]|nr:KamA family radical SAM protein [Planctomycetota bacterium]
QFSPVPGITHRYPDRVLFVISNSCAIYCRYCTRKRIMYEDATADVEIDHMVDYIARTPQVRDVVVSGGDPLTNSTPKLERILQKLRAIPHLEIIRIGSRVPVALPQRIDDELCAMLSKYHPLWINVHFNHPRELTPEAAAACDRLTRAGIPLNNQAVLLKGVNDSVTTIKSLCQGLMKLRVRPYYLYQCDPVRGAEHFRTTIAKGLEIMEGLRGHTSGLAIPTYVVDAPGGGGKIPVAPQYLLHYEREQGRAVLRNFQGNLYEYYEPRLDTDEVHPLPPPSGGKLEGSGAYGGPLTRPSGAPTTGAPRAKPAARRRTSARPAEVLLFESPTGANGGNANGTNGNGANGAHANGTNGNGASSSHGTTGNGSNGVHEDETNGSGANGSNGHAGAAEPVVGKSRWVHRGATPRSAPKNGPTQV